MYLLDICIDKSIRWIKKFVKRRCIALPILEDIKDGISAYLESIKPDFSRIKFDVKLSEYSNMLKFMGCHQNEYRPDKLEEFILLIVNEYRGQIHVPNIFLPREMHHHGIGLKMLDIIRKISLGQNYDFFIVDMVPSFYRRMRNRGALPCNEVDDAVGVVEGTDLSPHF